MLRVSSTLFRRHSVATRCASSLVVGEHDSTALSAATLSTITAASKIGGEITVLVAGKNIDAVAKHASSIANVSKVLTVSDDKLDHPLAETLSNVVEQVAKKYTHVLAPATMNGKNFMPRAAAVLNSSPLSDVIAVVDESTFKRPMYAGNAISTMKMTNETKFLLIRPTAFEKAAASDKSAPVEKAEVTVGATAHSKFLSASETQSERPDLTAARVVVSGGRGMKSAENFALLDQLADKLGGAVGASRAAVDAGYAPNEYQVGQTGKVVAPDLYIAVGISGAIQHLSGMKDSKTIVAINKDSKTIVAINKDKEAPIFQVADYGLVDDLFKAVPELTSKL